MKNRVWIFALLFFCAVSFGAFTAEQERHGIDVKAMNTAVKPCEDFYQFASGSWMSNNPIPADRASWGTGSELQERNLKTLHEILEEAARNSSAPKGSIVAKVGAFYRIGMDEAQIEKEGVRPLQEDFDRINNIKDAKALQDTIAYFHRNGISPAFGFFAYQDFKNSNQIIGWLYQGGLGLPDRDYYFRDDEKTKEIRKEYLVHVQKMFELLGDQPDSAVAEAKTVMDMETRLAKASMTLVEQRNPEAIYHMMQLSDLEQMAPQFSWSGYFQAIGFSAPGQMNIGQPEFFKEFSKMLTEVSLANWKTYLRWQLIHATAPYLSSAFVKEDFRFNSQVLRGIEEIRPRWKRVLESTDTRLGEALGQLYVAKAFPPEAKARAKELVANLRAALRDRIQTRDWIGEETRKQALRKLDAVMVKIGYPDKWRDYSALPVDRSSYVLNIMQADAFEFQRNLNKIGKPVDRTEWGISPPTVNAYYNPNFNEIVFPAGILQPPYFDVKADDAVNYGAIGSVIGHELIHGFDDQGRQFDAEGNLKDWWTSEDEKKYNSRAQLIENQFNQYIGVDDVHINGKLTLGENIADLAGLKISYVALHKAQKQKPQPEKIDGFTADQRFFIAFAQGWKRNTRPEQLRLMLATDPHSPAKFRVLGPLSNTPEFSAAFSCTSGKQSSEIW